MVATYPGTVSPLRGLDPFGEAERDVWHGREADRDALAKMVIADGFRAGLVYGEPGVGKTSLVRAGLIPHLRDHGVVALACEDLERPAASFAAGLSAFGIQPQPNELPPQFVQRAVANAVAGQQFVFVVDDVDLLCLDDHAATELADLFARVISRSAGRARFLFVCAHERMHALGALERRTGSLFPPSQRYELTRLAPAAAGAILDRVLSLSGLAADPAFAQAVIDGVSHGQPMLAADVQIAALAIRDLKLTTAAALADAGGAGELESLWLHDACKATGNERSALRLCAELASSTAASPLVPREATEIVARVGLDQATGMAALQVLEQRGVVTRVDPGGATWILRHEVLSVRVREHTAPARAAARKAHELLGSKTQQKGARLKLGELRKLKTEGIAPITPEERDVVARSRRHYMIVAGAIAAVPVAIVVIIWIAMSGRVFFDLEPRVGGDHVMVRGGRAGLSRFFWLPGSAGKVVADTGLTHAMTRPEAWKKVGDRALGATRGSWDDELPQLLAPQLGGLVAYATTGNDGALADLRKQAKENEDLAELLTALQPIARGGAGEVALVEGALAEKSPAVQRAAVVLAGAAARRRSDVYQDTLTKALASPDAELRRIAFVSVRSLGDAGRPLFVAALKAAEGAAQRELAAEVATVPDAATSTGGASVATAIGVLSDSQASVPLKERAKDQLRGALAKDPAATAAALTAVVAQDKAPAEARVFAIEQLSDLDPMPKIDHLIEAARMANSSRSQAVRAAALPLYARVDPVAAANDLVAMLDDKKLEKPIRVAAALAWGNVAGTNKDAVANALDRMLKDDDPDVRAAAAAASGRLGRAYQDRLIKMVKNEVFTVRIGAAQGLGATAETGGSPNVAVEGIAQMWREKGRPRREAVKVYAHLAKKKPVFVFEYLMQASRMADDPGLHPLGVEGLCNAALAGNADARRALQRVIDDPAAEVRRIAMACVADGPEPAKNGIAIAQKLVKDPDKEIRAEAAHVLALSAATKGQKVPGGVAEALVALLDDPDREVRLVGIHAIAGLGSDAPKTATPIMGRMFERGDEGEKLALLRTAKAIGAEDLIAIAIADGSPIVRVEAVEAALSAGLRARDTLSAALADQDPSVRKAALERLAQQKDKLDPQTLDSALGLAVRDPNPELSQLALTTIARVAPKEAVNARLHRSLASRAERERAQAAAAAIGLVDRDATMALNLLEPLLDDPSHDVRVAMLPALGAAYAKTNTVDRLADLMTDSEDHAMRRLATAAAFVTLAKTEPGAKAADAILAKLVADGPPMAKFTAKLVVGLLGGKADGIAFLQELVP